MIFMWVIRPFLEPRRARRWVNFQKKTRNRRRDVTGEMVLPSFSVPAPRERERLPLSVAHPMPVPEHGVPAIPIAVPAIAGGPAVAVMASAMAKMDPGPR